MSSQQPLLFIGGQGRSGTTLIERLLNELESTAAVGETVHLWERGVRDNERCGCGEPFDACPHWSAVGKTAFDGWDRVDVDRMIELRWSVDRTRRVPLILSRRGRTPVSSDEAEYLRALRTVLLASSEVAASGGPAAILIDSSKHLSTAALLSLEPALDVRVLHVVRDPRGVAYSWTKEVARPEAADGPTEQLMPQYSPARSARRWVSDNLGFEALGRLGVPTLRVRYEDFMAAPVDGLDEIVRFSEIDLDLSDPDRYPFLAPSSSSGGPVDSWKLVASTPMHSVAGNPLRFADGEQILKLDDDWRTELDPTDQRTVTRICAPFLRRYGYAR